LWGRGADFPTSGSGNGLPSRELLVYVTLTLAAPLGAWALTAYVAHLVIICLLARDVLAITIGSWIGYLATTLVILLTLILLVNLRVAAVARARLPG